MISSVSSSGMSAWSMQRPDISKVASNLFSQLDTQKQGYLEASDLEAAFSQISTDDSSSSSIASLFSQLDGDSDGKVSESELTSGLQQLSEQLDAGFNNMRTQGMQPPPPPPSGEPDGGYTEDELTSQLSQISSTDTQTSSLISTVLTDFSGADANGDGKVSLQEAMSFQQSTDESATSYGSQTSSSSSTDTLQAEMLRRMMQLMDAYSGYGSNSIVGDTASLVSSLSVSV